MTTQTAITDTGTATDREQVLNAIPFLREHATRRNIAAYLGIWAAGILDALEQAQEVTRTATGAYVLGAHKPTSAQDLELTSNDPAFGQTALF